VTSHCQVIPIKITLQQEEIIHELRPSSKADT